LGQIELRLITQEGFGFGDVTDPVFLDHFLYPPLTEERRLLGEF
jgi:hypothetical protein